MINNYLIYKYPEKVIMVIRQNEEKVIMSLRSTKTKLPDAISTALEGLDGFGGGHELACGAGVAKDQFPEFFERLQSQLI